jgi:Fe-S oxidoreductase
MSERVALEDVASRCQTACHSYRSILRDIDRLRQQQAGNAAQRVNFANEVSTRLEVCFSPCKALGAAIALIVPQPVVAIIVPQPAVVELLLSIHTRRRIHTCTRMATACPARKDHVYKAAGILIRPRLQAC